MMVVSVVLLSSVEEYYYKNFVETVRKGVELSGITSMRGTGSAELVKLLEEEAGTWFGVYGSRGNWMIVDRDWRIVNPDQESEKKVVPQLSKNLIKAMSGSEGYDRNSLKDGSFDYAVPITLSDGVYLLYIKYPKSNWGNTLRDLEWIVLVSTLTAVCVAFLLGYVLSRTITIPIRNLTKQAKKIAAGDFDHLIRVKSADEIGQLTHTFNHMARELKNTLNEISSEKKKVETILRYMTDGVMAFGVDGEIIHANPASVRMLNLDENRIYSYDTVFQHVDIGVGLDDILNMELNVPFEKNIETEKAIIKAFFVPFADKDMNVAGAIVVLQDITEQHRLDTMRKEFVANVSHELRTPLATIRSYIETLLDGELDNRETSLRFLNVINSESERMVRLVRDLLQLSKIDHDQANWNKVKFDLNAMVREAADKVRMEAQNKQQSLEVSCGNDSLKVTADRDRMEQVVLNIMSNAIKYTNNGGRIRVSVEKDGEFASISVKDNGIGIPREDLPRIFERFYRVDKARSREMGGTGLGLSIAREIVQAHGGDIFIDSRPGKGTEVTIRFPVTERAIS